MKFFFYMILCISIVVSASPAQVKSDYATVQKFKKLQSSIDKAIEEANTVQECAAVAASLDELDKEFIDDKALLDQSLYPLNYTKTFELMRGRLMVRQKDLGVIESQMVRITELETQVRELSGQVEKLTGENTALMGDIDRLKSNITKMGGMAVANANMVDSLKNVISKLQKQLKDRDQLIFALVDSLFLQYDKNVTDMKDIEKQGLAVKLERHGVFGNMRKSLEDNIKFLETTTLKSSDLVKVVQQQQRFQSKWKGVGPKLVAIYATGKKKESEAAVIDTLLGQWSTKVDYASWRTLNKMFKDDSIAVKEFLNAKEFVENFVAFVDEQIQNPKQEADDIRLNLFTRFDEKLWKGELENAWIPALAEVGKINEDQAKEINKKVDQWRSAVTPGATWLTYLLLILALALVALVMMRFLKKGKKSTP
jgi:hypothetical protein